MITGSANIPPVYGPDEFPFDILILSPCGRRRGAERRRQAREVCAFDIETTAYMEDGEEKRAMFCWQFSYDNQALCFGRTAEELQRFFLALSNRIPGYIINIAVHNLSYEFNFLYQIFAEVFGPAKTFFLDTRRIAKMQFDNLNFIDTFILCPMSLDRISIDYDLKFKKATGDIDYNKRFSVEDPLTAEELNYCLMDVLSLCEYYKKEMTLRGYNPATMPMTKTALVRTPLRKASRNAMRGRTKYQDWIRRIQNPYNVFLLLERGFQGGYTAINEGFRNRTIFDDIRCRDFTSSYPAWMLGVAGSYFPITAYSLLSEALDLSDPANYQLFIKALKNRCCLFEVEFVNIRMKADKVSPIISGSKCDILEDDFRYNGKIVAARRLKKVVNEVEFMDILNFYEYDTIAIGSFYIAKRGDLPEHIRDMILKLFRDKTQLKGINGKELEYLLAKADLNSIYGMMAMNPVREILELNLEEMRSEPEPITPENRRNLYNKTMKSRNTFLSYAWGMYVTTWARHHLFEAMEICGENWLYSDTDSVYYISTPEIESKFKEFNERITKVSFKAKNEITGQESTLGEMTPDGNYLAFRGLGAKKYALIKPDGSLKLTVAGVPKNKNSAGSLQSIDDFKAGHIFAGTVTGKLRPEYHIAPIHYAEVNGVMTKTASYINLIPTDYVLADSKFDEFVMFL